MTEIVAPLEVTAKAGAYGLRMKQTGMLGCAGLECLFEQRAQRPAQRLAQRNTEAGSSAPQDARRQLILYQLFQHDFPARAADLQLIRKGCREFYDAVIEVGRRTSRE